MRTAATVIARNEEQHIGEALESLLLQTRPPDRIIVIDDGSEDNTARVARSVLRGTAGAEVVQSPPVGRGAARNLAVGLCATDCDLVVVADADDVSLPDRVAAHVAAFEEDPDLDWHGGQIEYIDEQGRLRGRLSAYPTEPAAIRAHLQRGVMPLAHPASAFRIGADSHLPSGPYAPSCLRAQDLELILSMPIGMKVSNTNDRLLLYRVDQDDMSWKSWSNRRPWHYYAQAHAKWRQAGIEPIPYNLWYSRLPRHRQLMYEDGMRWILEGARSRGLRVPRIRLQWTGLRERLQ